jgi:hypothetical protein
MARCSALATPAPLGKRCPCQAKCKTFTQSPAAEFRTQSFRVGAMLQNESIRRFSTKLGSEAIRVGQAHGYQLEEILHLPPEAIARTGE